MELKSRSGKTYITRGEEGRGARRGGGARKGKGERVDTGRGMYVARRWRLPVQKGRASLGRK